jgi:hypothetical protein
MKSVNSRDDEAPTSLSEYVIEGWEEESGKIPTMIREGGVCHINTMHRHQVRWNK